MFAAGWAAGGRGFGTSKPLLSLIVKKCCVWSMKWDKMGGSSSNNCEISLKVREYSSFWLLTNLSREEESQENFSSVAHDHIEL